MITPKKDFFDRFNQVFKFFIKNYKLVIPVFIYTFIFWALFEVINKKILFNILWNDFLNNLILSFQNTEWKWWYEIFTSIITNPKLIFLFYFNIFVFLLSAILFIPIFIWLLKWISDLYRNEELDIKKTIIYWFKNFYNSFRTYRYMFLYIYMLPSLFIILYWLLFIYFMKSWYNYSDINIYIYIILCFWFFYIIWHIIYKSIKASFALYSAIDNDSFTKEDFDKSIKVTDNNLVRIFFNKLFFSLIIWFIISFIAWILKTIISIFWITNSYQSILNNIDINTFTQNLNLEDIISNIDFSSLWNFYILWFITSIIDNLFDSILIVIISIFMYILYIRLIYEKNNIISDKKEEL